MSLSATKCCIENEAEMMELPLSSSSSRSLTNPYFYQSSINDPSLYDSTLYQQPYQHSSNPDLEGSTTPNMTDVLDEFAALSINEPYGCTYLCGETFTSALEWRQHENRSHRQAELWRCNVTLDSLGTQCGKCLFSEVDFVAHLSGKHNVAAEHFAAWIEKGHLFGEGQHNFWCGFCRAIVKLENMGTEAWDERLDHVEAHFRNGDSIEKGWLKLREVRDA